jgi:pyridoxine 4-dehydrogenase
MTRDARTIMKATSNDKPAIKSGIFDLGGDLPVYRLGFGSMHLTGEAWFPKIEV